MDRSQWMARRNAILQPHIDANTGSRIAAKGDVIVVRYADDSVMGFETPEDTRAFLDSLRVRLSQFGLSLNEAKTRILEFGRYSIEAVLDAGNAGPKTSSASRISARNAERVEASSCGG